MYYFHSRSSRFLNEVSDTSFYVIVQSRDKQFAVKMQLHSPGFSQASRTTCRHFPFIQLLSQNSLFLSTGRLRLFAARAGTRALDARDSTRRQSTRNKIRKLLGLHFLYQMLSMCCYLTKKNTEYSTISTVSLSCECQS